MFQSDKHRNTTPALLTQVLGLLALLTLPMLLAALALAATSCLDEHLVSTTGSSTGDETDMYLNIRVPRTYAAAASGTDSSKEKENLVETLDVLVFKKGDAPDDNKYFVYTACKGTPATNADGDALTNTFRVVMPVGADFMVHIFVNCHQLMVDQGMYSSRGTEMNAIIKTLVTETDLNADATKTLPMHGYATMTISKESAYKNFPVKALRSAASVEVLTKATGTPNSYTPGELKDEAGTPNFTLNELYLYRAPKQGQIAANSDAYTPLAAGDEDVTRNVTKTSQPGYDVVTATSKLTGIKDGSSGLLYLYENNLATYNTAAGAAADLDTHREKITCLIVGGTYLGDAKTTYYRVDFADTDNKALIDVLRNHKYTFSIERVTGSGYATPDEAFKGSSTNLFVKLYSWTDDAEHVDYDRDNYFYSEAKSVTLAREANSARTLQVGSDVPVANWEITFADATNGTASPAATPAAPTKASALQNNRYKVEKAADGKSLVFTVLKAYNPLAAGESHDETLILKANRLQISYQITQKDVSPNDWNNGGDLTNDFGTPIPVGGNVTTKETFEFAPSNLIAAKNANGEYTYHFASEQGFITDYIGSRTHMDFYSWNSMTPNTDYQSPEENYNTANDACRKVGNGEWYTPSETQMFVLSADLVKGKWTMADGTEVPGYYFGTKSVPATAERNKYVFLPASASNETCNYWTNSKTTSVGGGNKPIDHARYISIDATGFHSWNGGRTYRIPIRCVRNKKSP